MRRSNRGFTLIEIMIVIAIIGIVITIGYPSLTEYVKKGRRAEVTGLLSEQAQLLERSQQLMGLRWSRVLFVNNLSAINKSGGSQKSWKKTNLRFVGGKQ